MDIYSFSNFCAHFVTERFFLRLDMAVVVLNAVVVGGLMAESETLNGTLGFCMLAKVPSFTARAA